jgi:hypothetical protein
MTPLYRRLTKRLTLPESKREPLHDSHNLLADLSDVHCFDCAQVMDLVEVLAETDWETRKLTGKSALSPDFPAGS